MKEIMTNEACDPDEIEAEIMLVEMELQEVRLWGKHAASPNRRMAAGKRERKLEQEIQKLKQTLEDFNSQQNFPAQNAPTLPQIRSEATLRLSEVILDALTKDAELQPYNTHEAVEALFTTLTMYTAKFRDPKISKGAFITAMVDHIASHASKAFDKNAYYEARMGVAG
jgi:predicted DNA binding CopG/RHH family protein